MTSEYFAVTVLRGPEQLSKVIDCWPLDSTISDV